MLSPAPNVGRLNFTPASMPQPVCVCWLLQPRPGPGPPMVAMPQPSVPPSDAGSWFEPVKPLALTLTSCTTPETWASPHPCLTCNAPTMSGHRWPPNVMSPGLQPVNVPELAQPGPVNCVPPPELPTEPGLSAEIVAEKPPPNEAV